MDSQRDKSSSPTRVLLNSPMKAMQEDPTMQMGLIKDTQMASDSQAETVTQKKNDEETQIVNGQLVRHK